MTSVGWVVPAADAVTLGELGGALYSVSPRDEAHLGDEFVRRGGSVLPPARVALSGKARRVFGRDESLTQELEADARDSGAVRMLKRAAGAAAAFLTSDELDVLQGVLDALRAGVRRITGGDDPADDAERDEVARAKESAEAVVAIGWHPSLSVLAVAQRDHVVSFYDVATTKWDARVLEHRAQVDISAVQWAPHSGGVLAVACRGGVFLWKVAVKKAGEEPVLVEVVKHPRKTSFHQLSWNADGSLLAAFAKNSSSVIVFDAIRSRSTELQCPYPPAGLHWCPTGEYLFATTHRGVSLMWEALTWKREVWEVSASACAWSGNGRCLLVSQRNSPLLFPYLFEDSPPSMDARINSPAIDFSEKLLSSLDKSASAFVGGKVERMTWDPTGRRVALIFSPTTVAPEKDSSSRLVAIFSVTWEPYLIFTQSGLLRGPPSSGLPRQVAFASSFEHGALLSVAWSSGLVSFYPFYLEDPLQSS